MRRLIPLVLLLVLCFGCKSNNKTKYYDPYGNEIEMPFDELCSKVAAEDYAALSEEDKDAWDDPSLNNTCEGSDSASLRRDYEFYRHLADSLEQLKNNK